MGRIVFAVLLAALLVAGCTLPGTSVRPQAPTQGPQAGQPKQVIAPQIIEKGQPKTIMPESFEGVNYTWYSSPMFFLYYPRGWAAEEPKNGVFAFTAPVEGDPEKDVADQLIIEIWAGDESTPEAYTNYEADYMVEGDQITNQESTKFKDRDAFVIEMGGKDERTGQPMFYKTIYFRNGKWVYRIQYALEKSRREKSGPLFKDMLDKFVVGDYQG